MRRVESMTTQEKAFSYKLDFYYQSALIYLVTLILYGGIRGNFVEQKFQYVLNDPIVYIICIFVVMSFVTLVINALRRRQLIVSTDAIIFRHRWAERRIAVSDIEWMHIGREVTVQTSGRFQIVVFKLKNRRRQFRIRIGRYERERELVAEMTRIAGQIPKRKSRRWRKQGLTDR
jgi:hypothetical protein